MNYLSINNSPEFNLEQMSKYQILVSSEVEGCLKENNILKSKLIFSTACVVSTVAIAIILGTFVSMPIGLCLCFAAVIPSAFIYHFLKERTNLKAELDRYTLGLKLIYQDIIKSLKVRQQGINLIGQSIHDQKILMSNNQDCDAIAVEINRIWPNILKTLYDELKKTIDSDEDQFNQLIQLARKPEEIEAMNYVKQAREISMDANIDAEEVRRNAEIIANMSLQPPVAKETWLELKQVCKELSRPYSSYFTVDEANYLVFQKLIENESNDSTL